MKFLLKQKYFQVSNIRRANIYYKWTSYESKWTKQYNVIDCEAYSKIQSGTGRTAYVHAVSEIYVPGSAGDDKDQHPTFPVAGGLLQDAA